MSDHETIPARPLSPAERAALVDYPDVERPRTRGDCADAPRPCPFVSCAHHLYLDVNERSGTIKINFPGVELEDLPESCALDVADRGSSTLQSIAVILNMTRERVRQIEEAAMKHAAQAGRRHL